MHRCKSASDRPRRRRAAAFVALWLAACGCLPPLPARADETLFDALGGQPGLHRIVHLLLQKAKHDPRISEKFDNINLTWLEQRLTDRLCGWTGGPCVARGPTMRGVHAGLDLTDRHFNALVEDLEAAMDEAATPYAAQNRLLALLAPMHRDIVTQPERAP